MSNRFYTKKLKVWAITTFKDPERKKITGQDGLDYLHSIGMPLSNWRNAHWVLERLVDIEFEGEFIIRIDHNEEYVGRSGKPTDAITLYGRIPEVDESYYSWEFDWYSEGKRGGVVGRHKRFLTVHYRITLTQHYRSNGLSETDIAKLTTEENVLKFMSIR